MNNIPQLAKNSEHNIANPMTQSPAELKIEQELPPSKLSFHHGSGFGVQNGANTQNDLICKQQIVIQSSPVPVTPSQSTQPAIANNYQVSKTPTQIVEENDAKLNTNIKTEINQLFSSSWFLPRHPNSLFKIIPSKPKIPRKRANKKILTVIPVSSVKSISVNGQGSVKQCQAKCQDQVKLTKLQPKTKSIHKNPNFKPRKGKNQQPMAQKFIKKLSGFHYNKNYKQNRNKTLKKLAKRGLAINIQNFSEYISKLKLQINKKFTKPDMKPKTNTKGEQINPKKSYDSYHSHFQHPRQREFIERFYNEVFKRVYVIMWKSDERLKRIDSIKIQGVQYDNNLAETDPSSEVKFENKQIEDDKQGITQSRIEDKRAMFVQCLDEQGKSELDRVFNEEYQRLYEKFSWGQILDHTDKDSFRKRVERFCWIQD